MFSNSMRNSPSLGRCLRYQTTSYQDSKKLDSYRNRFQLGSVNWCVWCTKPHATHAHARARSRTTHTRSASMHTYKPAIEFIPTVCLPSPTGLFILLSTQTISLNDVKFGLLGDEHIKPWQIIILCMLCVFYCLLCMSVCVRVQFDYYNIIKVTSILLTYCATRSFLFGVCLCVYGL